MLNGCNLNKAADFVWIWAYYLNKATKNNFSLKNCIDISKTKAFLTVIVILSCNDKHKQSLDYSFPKNNRANNTHTHVPL